MLAFLRYIRSTIKSSKSYILNKKLLVVGIGIIGIGVGLIFAETPIKLWPEIATVFIGVTILVLGVGLVRFVIFKFWKLWPEVATVYIGIIILGLGIGLVIPDIPFFHKGEILGIASILFIFWLGIATIFIGVMIAWFAVYKGRMIARGITIATVVTPIAGIIFAELSGGKLQEKVGEIRSELQAKVKEIVNPLDSIVSNTSANNSSLQNLIKHTSANNSSLQNLIKHTSANNSSLQNLIKHTSANNSSLQNLIKHTSANNSSLQNLIKHTSANNSSLQNLIKHTSANNSSLQNLIKHTSANNSSLQNLIKHTSATNTKLEAIKASLTDFQTVKALNAEIVQLSKNLESQKDITKKIKQDLKFQKDTTRKIKEELDEAKKAQNSVRLLIGTEEKLKEKDFLKTSGFSVLKSYRLSKKFSSDDSLIPIKHEEKPLTLKVDGSGKLELTLVTIEHIEKPLILNDGSGKLKLKELVYHSGKLKKDKYEKKEENGKITINFTNEFLGGMDILAVVKREK